jgi:hypothetical protein
LEHDIPTGTTTRTFLVLTRLSLMDKLSPIIIIIVIVVLVVVVIAIVIVIVITVIVMLSRSEEGILNIDSYSRYFSIDEKLQLHVFSRFYLATKLMAPHMLKEESRILRTRVLDRRESSVDTISTSLTVNACDHDDSFLSYFFPRSFNLFPIFHWTLNAHEVDTTSDTPSRSSSCHRR